MKSVRAVLPASPPPEPLSLLEAASAAGLERPVSLAELIHRFQVKTFAFTVTTPSPESLGGRVELTVQGTGTYRLVVRMRTSGLPNYSFRLAVQLRCGFRVLAFYSRGDVHGTLSGESRSFEDVQSGYSSFIRDQWDAVLNGEFAVSKEYENSITSWLESALLDIVTFVVGCATIGGTAMVTIVLLSELQDFTGLELPGDLAHLGLMRMMEGYFLLGPAGFIPVLLASIANFKQRDLRDDEIAAARSVFRDTIRYDNITITNLDRLGGRAFCAMNLDGRIMIGMGDRFDSPLSQTRSTLIHELTHAWQCEREATLETICGGLANELARIDDETGLYTVPGLNRAWGSYSREQQANLVRYFDDTRAALHGRDPILLYPESNYPPEVLLPPGNPFTRFIVEHIMLGRD